MVYVQKWGSDEYAVADALIFFLRKQIGSVRPSGQAFFVRGENSTRALYWRVCRGSDFPL